MFSKKTECHYPTVLKKNLILANKERNAAFFFQYCKILGMLAAIKGVRIP